MSGSTSSAGSRRQDYDYIIAGAGCAGLSLAVHMIASGKFSNKQILIVDKDGKTSNDRTWCFWETQPGLFEDIVFRKWERAWFYGDNFSKLLQWQPYQYKLIRGIDFYKYCFELIQRQKNITVLKGEVGVMNSSQEGTFITINEQPYYSSYIFNSILHAKPDLKKNEYWLLQHFKGWVIETGKALFDPLEPTLMDFRVDQKYGTAFAYCLPFTETKALIEYTLFTRDLLEADQYDTGLKKYIEQFLGIKTWNVLDKEFGVIPMTNHRFSSSENNIIHIGTAGGQTKASTGYTFRFIQKHSAEIVKQLVLTGKPFVAPNANRFHFYDSILLDILYHDTFSGKKIFSDLFKKNKPRQVLRFMDNESTVADELKIISSLPMWPFLKTVIKQW